MKQNMGNKKKALAGVAINCTSLIIASLIMFAQNRFFIRDIGINEFGLVSLFTQVLAYLAIIESGLSSAGAYSLYKPIAENDKKQIAIVFSTIKIFYRKVVLGFFIAGLGFTFFIPFFINGLELSPQIYLIWFIYLAGGSLAFLKMKFVIFMNADQKFNIANFMLGLNQIIMRIVQLLCIIIFHSMLLFVISTLIQIFLDLIFFSWYFHTRYREIQKLSDTVSEIEPQVKKLMKQLFWHRFAGAIVNSTSLAFISAFVSLADAGLYASYTLVVLFLGQVAYSVNRVLTPLTGNFAAKNNLENIFICFKERQILYGFFSIVVMIPVFYLMNPLIEVWIGKGYGFSSLTVFFICFNCGITMFRGNVEVFKSACGFYSDIHLPIIEAGVNFIVALVAVQYLGVLGVVLGGTASGIVVLLIEKPRILYKKVFHKTNWDFIKEQGSIYLLICIVSAISYFLWNSVSIAIDSWLELFYYGIILLFIALVITTAIFLISNLFRCTIKNLYLDIRRIPKINS